ncbi:Uncharacterised protein [Chlamydia trachomatis]|nr:Uncharacterised protein [Chlamydia trachomatis]
MLEMLKKFVFHSKSNSYVRRVLSFVYIFFSVTLYAIVIVFIHIY